MRKCQARPKWPHLRGHRDFRSKLGLRSPGHREERGCCLGEGLKLGTTVGGLSHPRGERVKVFIPASDSCWFREEFVGDLLWTEQA